MNTPPRLLISQRIVQICLLLAAVIAILGGALQMYLGQPDTYARLDNIHRFMAGIYFSMGIICFWTAITIHRQGVLIYLLGLGIFLGGFGRLVSIYHMGLPQPNAVWLAYLIPELLLPVIIVWTHRLKF